MTIRYVIGKDDNNLIHVKLYQLPLIMGATHNKTLLKWVLKFALNFETIWWTNWDWICILQELSHELQWTILSLSYFSLSLCSACGLESFFTYLISISSAAMMVDSSSVQCALLHYTVHRLIITRFTYCITAQFYIQLVYKATLSLTIKFKILTSSRF